MAHPKKQHGHATPPEKVYFLEDQPLPDLAADDAFEHSHYAHALLQILDNTDPTRSYTIGLFGKWGVGKTSVVNELKRILPTSTRKPPPTLVCLDAWEYSQETFRREFLIDLASHLDERQWIDRELTTEETYTQTGPAHLSYRTILILTGRLIVLLAVTLGMYLIPSMLGATPTASAILSIATLLVGGFGALFNEEIKDILRARKVVVTETPPVHPDQFRSLFRELLKKKDVPPYGKSRLIITLDNLDRVPEPVVLQVLASVKTFLNAPGTVFLLPCDDKGLKQHIINSRAGAYADSTMTEAEANEYLRKFFHTSVTIRDPLPEDLAAFIQTVLAQMSIFDLPPLEGAGYDPATLKTISIRNLDEVGLLLRVAVAKNPRRTIQLANKLTANLLVTLQKAKEDSPVAPIILTNLGYLMKLTILEEEWPRFHAFLTRFPDTLDHLTRYFATNAPSDLPLYLANTVKEDDRLHAEWIGPLHDFLQRTSSVRSPHTAEFLSLNIRPSAAEIPNYSDFKTAILSRDVNALRQLLISGALPLEPSFEEMLRELPEQSRMSYTQAATSILTCMTDLFSLIPEEMTSLRTRVASAVAERLSQDSYKGFLVDVGLKNVLDTLRFSPRKYNNDVVISSVISQVVFGPPELPDIILTELLNHRDLLTPEHERQLKAALEQGASHEPSLALRRSFASRAAAVDLPFAQHTIPESIVDTAISNLPAQEPTAKSALAFLATVPQLITAKKASNYADAAIAYLGSLENPLGARYRLGLAILSSLAPESYPPEKLEVACGHLASAWQNVGGDDKNEILKSYFGLLRVLSPGAQAKFQPVLLEAIRASDQSTLMTVIDAIGSNTATTANLDSISSEIAARARQFVTQQNFRSTCFRFLQSVGKPKFISELVLHTIPQASLVLASLDDAREILRPEDFRQLISSVIDSADRMPDPQISQLLPGLAKHKDAFNKAFRTSLTQEIVNDWLKKPSLEARRAASGLWKELRTDATRDDLNLYHGRLIAYIEQAISEDSIGTDLDREYVRCAVSDLDMMSKDSKDSLVRFALMMIEQGRSPQIFETGIELMQSLAELPEAYPRIPIALVGYVEVDTDTGRLRSILNTLAKYSSQMPGELEDRLKAAFAAREVEPIFQEFVKVFWPS